MFISRPSFRVMRLFLLLSPGLLPVGVAHAQHEDMAGMAMPDTDAMNGPLGIPHSRMGSGTSWLPDATPMYAYHWMPGRWTLMLHGQVYLTYDYQAGPRGDTQLGSTNWGMLMAMRPVGGGLLHLHGMLSLEPFTIGARGYPLLLQSGEAYRGAPLHDRQHPHDLFMELALMYEHPLFSRYAASIYLAPVGEPAIGPVAFMHRPSAVDDPLATLAHHWQDATHITYGVITGGLYTHTWKLEGTVFNGREPDDDRTDFDFRRLDSYGARLSINPSAHLAINASYGFLKSPEELEPDVSQDRIGASILFHRSRGTREWSAAAIYGANHHSDRSGFEHSVVVESTLRFRERASLFGRITFVQKSAADLVLSGLPLNKIFNLTSLTLGAERDLLRRGGLTLGLGGRASVSVLPADLEAAYGSRLAKGVALYLRLQPARAAMDHGDSQ
jgi:hypothetical protein